MSDSDQSTVSLHGVSFVAGLFWQPLASINSSERSVEIRSLAAELGLSFYVEHPERTCVGFSRGSKGGAPLKSLACAVISALAKEFQSKDFIYTAALPDGRWYYLAQKDGIVLSDGESIFESEDHARGKFFEDQSIGEWGALFTPVQWGISEAKESLPVLDLLQLAGGSNGKIKVLGAWSLAPVNPTLLFRLSRVPRPVFVLAFLALLAGAGYLYYVEQQRQIAQELEAQRIAAAAAAAAAEAAAEAPVALPPWVMAPEPHALLSACKTALDSVRLFPGNWTPTSITCNHHALSITWSAQERTGWISHLREMAPSASLNEDGSQASLFLPFAIAATPRERSDLPAKDLRSMEMRSALQRLQVEHEIRAAQAPHELLQIAPVSGGAPPPPPPAWGEVAWEVSATPSPGMVLEALQASGLVVNQFQLSLKDGRLLWSIQGVQYVRNQI